MFELNSKPKKIVVQKHSNANVWTTVAVVTKGEGDNSSFTEHEVIEFMNLYNDFEHSLRVLNEHNKVIMSIASFEFCTVVANSPLILVKGMLVEEVQSLEDGKRRKVLTGEVNEELMAYTCSKNKEFSPYSDFQRYIGRRGGIKHWKPYENDESDGFIDCGKLTFHDGSSVTISWYR
jgi:hypothetical protein